MGWNNSNQRKKFEARMKKQAEEYRAAGMTEEQIQAMYEFDLEQFKSDRRFYTHTQPLNECSFDDDSCDESDNGLLDGFSDLLSVTDDDSTEHSRFWWIEQIDDEALAERLKQLSDDDLVLLTLYVFDGMSQIELCEKYGCIQPNISKKLRRIKNFLKMR